MNFPGHDRSIGQRGVAASYHFDLAIIAPSGTDGPFAGMPALNEQIITRFPTIDLMHPRLGDEPQPPASSVTDEPITFHVLSPLNSERDAVGRIQGKPVVLRHRGADDEELR
jgi:hypothetical protein